MSRQTTSIVLPVLVTTLGVGWLLTVLNADPRIHWIPVLGMPVLGLLVLLFGGLDKVTLVISAFLFVCTGFALARQMGHISVDVMLPCLVIAAGLLAFVAHFLPVPYPQWLQQPDSQPEAEPKSKKLRLEDQQARRER